MKRTYLSVCLSAVTLCAAALAASGQAVKSPTPSKFKELQPVHHPKNRQAVLAAIAHRRRNEALAPLTSLTQASPQQQQTGLSVPLWDYSIVAGQDGNTYQGSIVGRSPYYNGHRSTTIQAYLVPVILTFPDGTVFDPTAPDSCINNNTVVSLVQGSPVFQTTDFTFTDSNGLNPVDVGTTQYGDAFQRANFWQYVAPNANLTLPYDTLLSLNTLPAISVSIPAGYGFTNPGSCQMGMMDYDWWDSNVEFNLISSLAGQGVGPNTVPIFIFDSVVMYLNGDSTQCCALGDHGSYLNASNVLQTYIVANIDTTGNFPPDVAVLSHEVGEWINDPDNINPTPSWSSPVQPGGDCQNTYEVGDALQGYIFPVTMPNGITYNPQELVYFSWFYNQTPSIGAGGWYSDQGTFTTDAGAVCQ